jgi:hypothetical protein
MARQPDNTARVTAPFHDNDDVTPHTMQVHDTNNGSEISLAISAFLTAPVW